MDNNLKVRNLLHAIERSVPRAGFTLTVKELQDALKQSKLILLTREEFRNLMQND